MEKDLQAWMWIVDGDDINHVPQSLMTIHHINLFLQKSIATIILSSLSKEEHCQFKEEGVC